MRMHIRSIIAAVAAVAVTMACAGKSESEQAAEQAQKAAEQVKQAAEQAQKAASEAQQDAAKNAAELAKGFEAIARGLGAAGGGAAAEPVSFRDLQTAFPELPGWTRSAPTGEKMTSPVSFSQSEIEYERGQERIKAKIIDSAFNQLLLAPFATFLVKGYERQTQNGYEKSIELGANPGWEKWNAAARDGELSVLVAKRFLLTLDGDRIEDTKPLYELASRVDFAKLSALK
jgi:hypothetical protein